MTTLTLDIISKELCDREQWVCYSLETRDGDETKIPRETDGSLASTTDPSTWCSFEEVVEAAKHDQFDGVGFVFSENDTLVGIDLDDCIDDTGTISEGARNIVEGIDSYTEISPSGNGLHIIAKGFLTGDGNRSGDVPGMKELEAYEQGRYFTMTGDHLEDTPQSVEERPKEIDELCEKVFGRADTGRSNSAGAQRPNDLEDRELVEKAKKADDSGKFERLWNGDTRGYESHSEAQQALANKLAFWTGGDKDRMLRLFRDSGMPRGDDDIRKFKNHDRETALDGCTEFYDSSSVTKRPPDLGPQTNGHAKGKSEAEDVEPFWYTNEKGKLKIDRSKLIGFLRNRGFGKTYIESELESRLVRVTDHVVQFTSRERIKDFTLDHVREAAGEKVVDALLKGANVYFSSALFEFLPPLDLDFHSDTAEKAFFYYENGFVEVTKDGFELRPYSELDGVIWEDQIIDREFVDLTDEDPTGWVWHEHLLNVAGRETQRHNALCTSLGYLLHGYKDPAVTKAIILMDEKDTEVEEGRTGKSMTAKGLQHMSPTLRIDGRNFSFDSRFAFQEVGVDTQIVDFNDVRERFPFERLFSVITDDFPIERKGKDRVTIPFEDSPKFVLSTNYVIEGKGASFEDRTHQIEFSDYYGTDHTPQDEFGHRLFDDWGPKQWAQFDNVMMACVRQYLRDGLTEYEHVNVDYRRLKQHTCPDFAEWAVDFFEVGTEYEKEGLWRTFREAYAPDYEDLSKSKFGHWLNDFARIYELDKQQRRRRSDGTRKRYIKFRERG